MTAATITPATTADDLIGGLRDLLGRHDGASTLEELEQMADEATALLRRTRGRIGALRKRTRPAPAEQPADDKAKKADAAESKPEPKPEPKPAAQPDPKPEPQAAPAGPDAPAPRPPAPVRPPAAYVVLAALLVTWLVLADAAGAVRRGGTRVVMAARRAAGYVARSVARRLRP